MVDQLRSFASEVTRVAREVGTDGKLGGQAKVPGAAGTWRMLVDNVNQLSATLTSQVRAISEVATAGANGEPSPSATVEAHGYSAAGKDNAKPMIINIPAATPKNTEQD